MSPDDHLAKAEELLAEAVEPDLSPQRASVLLEAACLHTKIALHPVELATVTTTSVVTNDEMAAFTQAQGLDDIREWHADAAPKADQLDDFDAWLHVRDVGKLLAHIDRQDMALTLEGGARDRQRAKAGEATQQALQYKAALMRLVAEVMEAAEAGPQPQPLQRELAEAEALIIGEPVPSTGEDTAVLTDAQFRALMDLVMVSDPTPLAEAADKALTGLLDAEATSRGFDSWHVAYHELHRSTGEDQSGKCATAGCDIQGWNGSCSRCGNYPAGRFDEEAPSPAEDAVDLLEALEDSVTKARQERKRHEGGDE